MEINDEKEVRKESDIMPEKPDYAKELEAIIKSDVTESEIREQLEGYHEEFKS